MYRRILLIILILIFLVTVIASSIPFRQYPTHMIVKQVNCFSCHPYELNDLKNGMHIRIMNTTQSRFLYDYLALYGNVSEPVKSLEGACYSCHITYENFNQFGLTDPYTYYDKPSSSYNAQYGYIINWAAGNSAVDYFSTGNVAISAQLTALSILPSNSAVQSDLKILLANYSGQQTGNTTVYDSTRTLYQGDTQTLSVGNIAVDYFDIILLLDGVWNNSTLKLSVNGTDNGTQSFTINAAPPAIYNIPRDISGLAYLKTNGTLKAVRLDYMWGAWINYSVGNIATSEVITTNSTNGWISRNSCSTPDGMCHINQEVTYMGLSNTEKSFYTHKMEYVTSKQCKICHLQ